MIKKILSILLSFILLTPSLSTSIFAGYDDIYYEDIFSSQTNYPQKSKAPKKSLKRKDDSALKKKKRVIQKAFLIALLCSLGVDVEVDFNLSNLSTYDNFLVTKVGKTSVRTKNAHDNTSQLKAIIQYISENLKTIKLDLISKGILISSAIINERLLNQRTIYEIGGRILGIIQSRRQNLVLNHIYKVNLKSDSVFTKKTSEVLGNLLNADHIKDEGTYKFFELPSCTRNLEPIQNPVHVNYLKEHPENSSLVSVCYQKTFLAAILSTFGVNISVKPQLKATDKNFPECIIFSRINNHYTQTDGTYHPFLVVMIKLINEFIPAEKLKIETVAMSYSIPTKITINKSIILRENDIFNLGQRFYNLIYEMLSKGTLKAPNSHFLVYLHQSDEFIQNVKKIFKEYTGTDLPDITL